VSAHLQAHHATVRTAASAAEAFARFEREIVDVLLADIAMPDEDGYELTKPIEPQALVDAVATLARMHVKA
jgi:CheY-like chemotaxis protein